MFRGRETHHPELGRKILDRIAEEVDGSAKVEAAPRLDGRNMVMVLAPDKRAQRSAAARAERADGPGDPAVAANGAPAQPAQGAGAKDE
jgi:translation initiation factor IF-3